MRAEHLEDGTIAVSGKAATIVFNRICAGVGWPDLDAGYICVVGERIDGMYHCLWEKQGGLWEIGGAAREAKDRFLMECVWVDGRDPVSTTYLRTLEGLCFHEDTERRNNPDGDSTLNTLVRLYVPAIEHTTCIVSVQDAIASNYRSALEKTREVIITGRLAVHESNCPKLIYLLRQPVEAMLKSPVMKGLVWVVTGLETTKGQGIQGVDRRIPWYGNYRKNMR